MDILSGYLLFLAKTLTILFAILIILASITSMKKKQKTNKNKLKITHFNKELYKVLRSINEATLTRKNLKNFLKKTKKDQNKDKDKDKNRTFVLSFSGDIKASAVNNLREEISAILMIAKPKDEVFLKLESPGGMVNNYGLAASQLSRIKAQKIPLTISVDKVAASGGYLMACVANKIIAAPFAIIGSIGVIAQVPNFNKALKKHNIEYNEFKGGEFKRTVTFFGENSKEDKQKFQSEIDDTHLLFKEFVAENRPKVNIKEVATGEHWYGQQAIKYKLIDEINTSDDYLINVAKTNNIYTVTYEIKKHNLSQILKKVALQIHNVIDTLRPKLY